MPTMTKTECISHIRAIANKIKTAWETDPKITAQELEKRFELINAHVQTELTFLNHLPEIAEEIDYRMCLLSFMTYGSSKNEKFLIVPTDFENPDNEDALINEYAIMHKLLTEIPNTELFLNRNHRANKWEEYLRSHPGISEDHYRAIMASQQGSKTQVASSTSTSFFSTTNTTNTDGGETAEPNFRR